jgi:hypothetical protein
MCNGTGYVEYYHDAGDHFGAGTAPNSEWRQKPCPKCKTYTSEVKEKISTERYPCSNQKAVAQFKGRDNKAQNGVGRCGMPKRIAEG